VKTEIYGGKFRIYIPIIVGQTIGDLLSLLVIVLA